MFTLLHPTHDLFRLSGELDKLLNPPRRQPAAKAFTPAIDVEEDQERYLLRADLPGVEEKDISLHVHEGKLILSGRREPDATKSTVFRERRAGAFQREFYLGEAVNSEKIEASYKNGVLTVVLPKKEEVKPRQIPVTNS